MTQSGSSQSRPDGEMLSAQDQTVFVDVPTELGPYRLTRILGRGGMGEVWQAFDTNLERDVAVKLMRRELLANEEAVRRFAREARAVARLNHGNIVQVYAFGDQKGVLYFVMEMVEGDTITDEIKRRGCLPLEDAVLIQLQAIEGLSYASVRGIVHRDIKPSNLMYTPEGRVKIADFGLAKMMEQDSQVTAAGSTMGSPNYMSPEQARGEEADHRSDIYSLGITFYQMLTGTLPFTAPTALSVLLMQIQNPLPETDFLKSLADGQALEIIKRMTQKRAADRYQTYAELAAEVAALAPGVRFGKSAYSGTMSMSAPASAPGAPPSSLSGEAGITEADAERRSLDTASGGLFPAGEPGSTKTFDGLAAAASPPGRGDRRKTAAVIVGGVALLLGGGAAALLMRPDASAVAPAIERPAPAPSQAAAVAIPSGDGAAAPDGAASVAATTSSASLASAATTPAPETTPAVPVATVAPVAVAGTGAQAAALPSQTVVYVPVVIPPTPTSGLALIGSPPQTPYPTPVPTPYPTPVVSSAQYVQLAPDDSPNAMVQLYDESGAAAFQIPARTTVDLKKAGRVSGRAAYLIEFQGKQGYVLVEKAKPVYVADGAARPTPDASAGSRIARRVTIGTQGKPGTIEVYQTEQLRRPVAEVAHGTEADVLNETAMTYIVRLAGGAEGHVLKTLATPRR